VGEEPGHDLVPAGAAAPVGEQPGHQLVPAGAIRPLAPTGGTLVNKRPRRVAADVPASTWRDEGYKITGRKRNLAIINEPATLEEVCFFWVCAPTVQTWGIQTSVRGTECRRHT
jgi:hypothetical protein